MSFENSIPTDPTEPFPETTSETETNNTRELLVDPKERVMIEFGMVDLLLRCEEEKYDTLVYLDKSARPFSWILRDSWPEIYPDVPKPQQVYVNPPGTLENYEMFAKAYGKHISGKVCMVDERAYSGFSFNTVETLIRTIPTVDSVARYEVMQIWPSWFHASDRVTGVTDKDIEGPENSYNSPYFVSTPNNTKESERFRSELKSFSKKVANDFEFISSVIKTRKHVELEGYSDLLRKIALPFYISDRNPVVVVGAQELMNANLGDEEVLDIYMGLRSNRIVFKEAYEDKNHDYEFFSDSNEVVTMLCERIEGLMEKHYGG